MFHIESTRGHVYIPGLDLQETTLPYPGPCHGRRSVSPGAGLHLLGSSTLTCGHLVGEEKLVHPVNPFMALLELQR